jgi:hypothetical protein
MVCKNGRKFRKSGNVLATFQNRNKKGSLKSEPNLLIFIVRPLGIEPRTCGLRVICL